MIDSSRGSLNYQAFSWYLAVFHDFLIRLAGENIQATKRQCWCPSARVASLRLAAVG